METYTTDAINIKTYPISENDNIVVMFSKEKGIIKGVAKGVKRPKSKLGARMQALFCNNLMLGKKRNLDIIKEACALNTFNKLRHNLDKLTMALYVVEIINTFCAENSEDKEQNENIYSILYKTLDNIQNSTDKTQAELNIIKFQLHFMNEMGFGLEFKRCLKCSAKIEEDAYLSLDMGGVVCTNCNITIAPYVKLHKKIREFLIALVETPLDVPTKYDSLVNERVTETCLNLLKKYIEIIANKKSKTFKVMEDTKVS